MPSSNDLPLNTVVADTINFKEGSASADFESTLSQYMSIADASLNAGFPLKNGDTNKVISVCFWIKIESKDVNSNDRLCRIWVLDC